MIKIAWTMNGIRQHANESLKHAFPSDCIPTPVCKPLFHKKKKSRDSVIYVRLTSYKYISW